jgi:ABC-type spermidine/putrescine transport system permease subunit II
VTLIEVLPLCLLLLLLLLPLLLLQAASSRSPWALMEWEMQMTHTVRNACLGVHDLTRAHQNYR